MEDWMVKEYDAYYKEVAKQDRRDRLYALYAVIRQKMKWQDNWSFNWWQKVFYITKTLICLILDRRRSLWACSDAVDSMACWSFRSWTSMDIVGQAHDWTELAVGYGYFSNWYYDIYSNSDA